MKKSYFLYIDYKAVQANNLQWSYEKMEAQELGDAMREAIKKENDSIYLMRIMVQQGKTVRDGVVKETYMKALVENRGHGWNIYGGEHEALWREIKGKDGTTIAWGEAI